MIKRTSHPPLLILLDLLFILIFILILDNKAIKIEIPKYALFKDAILVLKEDKFSYKLNPLNYQKEEILDIKDNYIYFQSCETQCSNAPIDIREKINIYFPNNLFNNISKITFLGMHTSYNCKSLHFKILDDGKIDKKHLLEKNTCLKQIHGL